MNQLTLFVATDDRDFGAAVAGVIRSSGITVDILEAPPDDPAQAPHVVVVDVRGNDGGDEKVERVRARWAAADVVAVAGASDPDRILKAMRAGANEFADWPAHDRTPPDAMQNVLRAALRKTSSRLQIAARQGGTACRVLSFFGTKGGVGTTTLAVNCATELARTNERPTLIVDLNPFIGEVGLFLGVRPRFTVVDALDSLDRLDEVFLKKLVASHKTGLDIMAGSEMADRPNAQDSGSLEDLFRVLKHHYADIVLDGGMPTNAVAPAAIMASDACFLVANPDVASIRNARRMVDRMRRIGAGPDRVKVLLNRIVDNPAFAPDQIEEVVGRPVEQFFPSDYRTVSEALNSGVPLTTTNNTELAAEFSRFVKKLSGVKSAEPAPAARPGQFLGLF